MRNLKSYTGDTFQFYKSVIASKKESSSNFELKKRLAAIDTSMRLSFIEFDDRFSKNELEELLCCQLTTEQKKDLENLYSYRSKLIQELKITLTTSEFGRVMNTCQNCTINEVNSFDHLLPKNDYSEFTVNPKNLFPSCAACNTYKSKVWKKDGKRAFLNLYLDALPSEQYLFVDITNDGYDLDVSFLVENRNNIDLSLFSILKNHYEKLHLPERFKENCDNVISPLVSSLSVLKGKISLSDSIEVAKDTSLHNMRHFGNNYWKSILELALLNNNDFLNRFR
ncbi:hypothetical protein [Chitinophaga sp.]|uniref:hypothetical protein n=1 Tax=Chitinophaga sp. TaxID=1869181 RepID=UPI0031DB9C88